jgi:hypothetical protein
LEDPKKEAADRKKAIYSSMSPRRRKRIDKIGYENWDPFEEPKDPIEIRRDRTKRTTHQLVQAFLQENDRPGGSNAYARGVLEIALGIINKDDRFLGMYDFCVWYREELKKEGYEH